MKIYVKQSEHPYHIVLTDEADMYVAIVHEDLFDDRPDILKRLRNGEVIQFDMIEVMA